MRKLKTMSAVLGLVLASSPAVLAGGGSDSPELTIGAGATMNETDTSSVQALLRVEFNYSTGKRSVRYVIATLRADAGIDVAHMNWDDILNNATYLDLDFQAMGVRYAPSENAWVGVNAVGANAQRNLAISNDLIARVSVAGLQAGFAIPMDGGMKFVLNGALDMLGYAMVREQSGDALIGEDFNGLGHGAKIEGGLAFNEGFRVMLGHKVDGATGSADDKIASDWQCMTGNGSSCKTYTSTQTYLDVMYSITKSLSAFGRASYSVYKIKDAGSEIAKKDGLQFRLGVGYRL